MTQESIDFKKDNFTEVSKTCFNCQHRVLIGENFHQRNIFLRIVGIPIIYIPFPLGSWLLLYFIGLFSYCHLKLVGSDKPLKKFNEFLPDKKSHRYIYKTQIVMGHRLSLNHSKLFWLFNCTWYCPMSVGLLEWGIYLAKCKKAQKQNIFLAILNFFSSIILFPFFGFSWIFLYFIGLMCYLHLRLVGASKSLKTLKSFFINNNKSPIINGNWYCPLSVALLEWCSYLVKVVEVWWCPFFHNKKKDYVAISKSFWHLSKKDRDKMHPDDRNNPMFSKQ